MEENDFSEESSSTDSFEEGSEDSPSLTPPPKALFVLDNIPPRTEFDHRAPPVNLDPMGYLAYTYGELVESILDSTLCDAGHLGGIFVLLRGEGYVKIRPFAVENWNIDAFPRRLREISAEGRIQEGNMLWYPADLYSVAAEFPRRAPVLGCLLTDDGRLRVDPSLHEFMESRVPLRRHCVFVVGNYLNNGELAPEIHSDVRVLNHDPMECISILCQVCEEKWNLI